MLLGPAPRFPLGLLLPPVGLALWLGTRCLLASEITSPRLVQGRPGGEAAVYELRLGGGRYLLYLRKQSLLPPGFSIYVNGAEAGAQYSREQAQHDCLYQGVFLDLPNSTAALRACGPGLTGLLTIMEDVYSIEPLLGLPSGQHLVSRLDPASAHSLTYLQNASALPQEPPGPALDFLEDIVVPAIDTTRYLKLAVFVARDLWAPLGGTVLAVANSVVRILQTLNTKFRPLNIRISLVLLDIWAKYNPITLGSQLPRGDRYAQFNNYINKPPFAQRTSLTALLLTYESSFGHGMTYFGKVCSRQFGAISVYQGGDLEDFAVHIAHILGHTVGLMHDDNRRCQCAGRTCIMHEHLKNGSKALTFSSCSVDDFQEFVSTFGATCLLVSPHSVPGVKRSLCGNKRLDKGEDCDCGTALECKRDPCCNPNCKFKGKAKCASGPCCNKCQLLPCGTECRAPANECDFPEYCDGVAPTCPRNVFHQNGNLCNNQRSYCFNGQCQNLDAQCKQLFGADSRGADELCFFEDNILQERFENCHGDPSKCAIPDVRCGKMQCTYPSHVPTFSMKAAIQYYGPRHCRCASVDFMPSSLVNIVDLPLVPLLIPDGAKCGKDELCLSQKCQHISNLNVKCNAKTDCNSRGWCNSKGNCHCDIGWEPPTCKNKGNGGSIDSGSQITFCKVQKRNIGRGLTTWLVVVFCFFVPLFIICIVLIIKWEEIRNFCRNHIDTDDSNIQMQRQTPPKKMNA